MRKIDHGQAYKFYGKMNFSEAVGRCQKDGTFLAMAKSRSDADEIKLLLNTEEVNESRLIEDFLRFA